MAVEVERMVAVLEARMTQYEKSLKKAVGDTDSSFRKIEKRGAQLENRLATLGKGAFATIGPNIAAAAASLFSLQAAINGAREALDYFGKISDQSAAAGVDSEFFQGLAYNAQLAGIEIDGLAGALATFAKNSGQLGLGQGRLYSTLKQINPALIEQLQLATSQEQRLRLVADAIAAARDSAQQATIASAAFGDQGVKLVSIFKDGAGAVDLMMQKAREAGVVVSRTLIEKADELGDKFDAMNMVIDTKLRVNLYRLSAPMLGLKQLAADFLEIMAIAADQMNEVSNREFLNPLQNELANTYNRMGEIKDRIALLTGDLEALGDTPTKWMISSELTGLQDELATATARANELLDRIQQLQGYKGPETPSTGSSPVDAPAFNPNMLGGADLDLGMNPLNVATKTLDGAVSKVGTAAKTATASVVTLKATVDETEESVISLEDSAKGFAGSFVNDILDGKSAVEALHSALSDLARQLANSAINSAIGSLFGAKPFLSQPDMSRGFGAYGTFAKGTNFAPGGLALVGEQGPELVNLPRGAQVIPNHRLGSYLSTPKLADLGGGRGGAPGTINIALRADSSLIAEIADQRVQTAAGTIVNLSVQRSTQAVEKRMSNGSYRQVGVGPGLRRT